MRAEHQKKKELKLKKHWTRLLPLRSWESLSENEISFLYRSHFRVFLLDASVYFMFFLLPISIALRFSRTDDIVKPSWAASAVPNTSQHGLGSISQKSCHVAMSQNQSQWKSLTSKICWCFLIIIHFHFAQVSGALLQLDVDRMPRHIHRNSILLSHPTCTQSFNPTGLSNFR